MITLSCSRWYLNMEGAHLCLSSHPRIPAISDKKSTSGGQLYDNCPHPVLPPQRPGEGAAPGWGTSPTPLPFGLGPAPLARSHLIHGKRQKSVNRSDSRARLTTCTAWLPLYRRVFRAFRTGVRAIFRGRKPRIGERWRRRGDVRGSKARFSLGPPRHSEGSTTPAGEKPGPWDRYPRSLAHRAPHR